jgi:crotonobetainyl-CoA:carnitine CoA-transferase CaiB-like acyl-CoA transferase
MTDAAPLAGIRVIDLGWLTAGAASSTLLLDLGAEVIKIEGPGALDPFRDWTGADPCVDWWNRLSRSERSAWTGRYSSPS